MGEAPRKSLRQDFAQWMQTDLGYATVHTNVRIDAASSGRAYTVDVRAERWSANARRLQSAAWLLFGAAVVLENVTALRDALFVPPNALLGVSVVVFVLAYTTKSRTRECAWVSCKDEKKPLGPDQVQSLRDAVDTHGSRNAARFIPDEAILVSSAAGFETSAVELAKLRRIQCYRRIDTGFERVA